jgi:hypothetical protein
MVGTITEPHVQRGAGTIFAVSRSLASSTMAVRPATQLVDPQAHCSFRSQE